MEKESLTQIKEDSFIGGSPHRGPKRHENLGMWSNHGSQIHYYRQSALTCSEFIIKTLEQGVKYVQSKQ